MAHQMTKTSVSEFFKKDSTVKGIESLKAVGYALLIGAFLILVTGQGGALFTIFEGFWTKNFGNKTYTATTLAQLSYLIPLGLALVVSFRMGLFNIGSAGQALGGGIFAALIGSSLNVGQIGFVFTLFFGIVGGIAIAMLIGWLKVKFNINEVISSIMLNWMIMYVVRYFAYSESISVLSGNDLRMDWVYSIFGVENGAMNFGFLLVLPLPFVFWFLYKKTKWGYKQDLIGNNPKTGDYLGINSKSEIMKTMMISGGLAGLAGTIYLTGIIPNIGSDFKNLSELPGWTFDGITIALLGFNSPIGVIASAFVISLFSDSLDNLAGKFGIVSVMVAFMIIFIARSTYKIQYGNRGYIKFIKEKYVAGRSKNKGVEND